MTSQVTPKYLNNFKNQQEDEDYFISYRQIKNPQRLQSHCEVEVIQSNKTTNPKRTFNKFKLFNNDKSFSCASQKSNNSKTYNKINDQLQKVSLAQNINKKQKELQLHQQDMSEMWRSFISHDFKKINLNDFREQKLTNKTLQEKCYEQENRNTLKKYKSNENLLQLLNEQHLDKKIQKRTRKLVVELKPDFIKEKPNKKPEIAQQFKKQKVQQNLITSPSQNSLPTISRVIPQFKNVGQPTFCSQCAKMKQKIRKAEKKILKTKQIVQQISNLKIKFKQQLQIMQLNLIQTVTKVKEQLNRTLSTTNSLSLISQNGVPHRKIVQVFDYKFENIIKVEQKVASYKLLDQAISEISKDIMRSLDLEFQINSSYRKDMAGKIIKNYIPNELSHAFKQALHQYASPNQCEETSIQIVKSTNADPMMGNANEIKQKESQQLEQDDKLSIIKTYSLPQNIAQGQLREMVIEDNPTKIKYSQSLGNENIRNKIIENNYQYSTKAKSEDCRDYLNFSNQVQNLKRCLDNLKQLKHEEQEEFMSSE